MDLVLVRHAEPERLTVSDTRGAPANPSLTERGRAQSDRLAAWLRHERFDALYTSSKARAIETAIPVASAIGLTAEIDDGWLEYDAHSPDYIPMEELRASKDPRLDAMTNGDWTSFGAAEPAVFRSQVSNALDATIGRHGGERVLVVCHGGVINVALALVAGLDQHLWFDPGYTSISRIVASRGGVRSVVSVNETAHLVATRQSP